MKLRYFRARNVLSFGDGGIELEFGPFSVIAGPNDSGKTNLFRALSLIEKAFEFGKPSLDEIIFQGESDRSLYLEVGVELDDTELELLVTLIICSEIERVQRPEDITQGITENKLWKSILTNYGYQILLKSLRCLSFVLTKDELRTSEPKMVVQLTDGTGLLCINRSGYLSDTSEELGGFQRASLAKVIIEDFTSRFGNLSEPSINSLVQNIQKLEDESPTLVGLLKGKFGGSQHKMFELRGADFNQYVNTLRTEPILAKLSRLCEQRGIRRERLYLLEILGEIYKTSFIKLQELRVSPPTLEYSGSVQDSKGATILGSNLATKLFWLKSLGTRKNREKYNEIQAKFKSLTKGSEFDVAVRIGEIEVPEGNLGVLIPYGGEYRLVTRTELSLPGAPKEVRKLPVIEVHVQVIKDNYPITIEQAASGLYEILFLLTTILGESGKILLLDEPELHLHPTMQKRILGLLSEVATRGENQILLITHSPYLVPKEQAGVTWRFTKTERGTEAHNLGSILSKSNSETQDKLAVQLSNSDVRSLLFSRGVIFVEGPSDKIVVEQTDRYLSIKNEGANIGENEWSVIDIGGKKNLPLFMTLSRMLGVKNISIMDYDALMRREHSIKLDGRELKTSSIISALWRQHKLENCVIQEALSSEATDSEWHEPSLLEKMRTLCLENDIFVFSTDLEGVIQSPKTDKRKKPLKALERILELISQDSIPQEFYEMSKFLRKYTSERDSSYK
jgi:energy-coupling factor transporter ATP-binding protein EcfA2